MVALFHELTIKGMRLPNRLVRSATWEGMCALDGSPTGRLKHCYLDLAHGGVGLIITGYAYVSPEGRQLAGQMGMDGEGPEEAYRTLTSAVHGAGGLIAVQLVHAGGQTDTGAAGRRPLAPSSVEVLQFPEVPEEMTIAEIRRVIADFGRAAARALDWGFDAVQLHGAHGYLINQFLSPHTNRRTDIYGGPILSRARFLFEVYEEVRGAVGSDYPVLIKLTASDNLEGGLTAEDARIVATRLSEMGIDAIEVSSGTRASGRLTPAREQIDSPRKEAYNLGLAVGIKSLVSCPVGAVGGFRSFEVAECAIREGGLDFVSMARPFIWEPDLVARWESGDRTPARCISCNGCFRPGIEEGGIYCVVRRKWERGPA